MRKRLTTEEFTSRSITKHGEKYNYNLVDYVDSYTKVEIICNQGHPNFFQLPANHLNGSGCYLCGRISLESKQKKSQDDFVNEAESTHQSKYTYSKVNYKNTKSKVIVTCKEHGDFTITPSAHLNGQGCARCKHVVVGNANRGNLNDSLLDCIKTHGALYDYSLVTEYNHDREKISVVCSTHGVFPVSWNNHKRGRGCPKCAKNGYNKAKPGTFYILIADNYTKVGITNRAVELRVKPISKSSGQDFKINSTFFFEDGSKAANIETQVLSWLKTKYQQATEVFDGSTECFLNVNLEELLNFISPLNSEQIVSQQS